MPQRSRRRRSQSPSRPPARQHLRWRETLNSWGGISVIGTLAVATILLAVFLFRQPLGFSQSDADLLGEVYPEAGVVHVEEGSLTDPPSQPPAGGPHYPRPWPTGISDELVADGYLIHSLEHGMVWFSYQPDLVSEEQLARLEEIADQYSNDVILAPRPANDAPLYALSWGRTLEVDPADEELLRQFVETNRNRSPEPGIR